MFEVWASTKNTQSKLKIRTPSRIKAEEKYQLHSKYLHRLKGGVELFYVSVNPIGREMIKLQYWKDYEIVGRHNASHRYYNVGEEKKK